VWDGTFVNKLSAKEEKSMKKTMIGTVTCFLLAAGPVFAGSSTELSDSQLQVKNYDGIPYVSGGFGIEERENLRTLGKNDNLELSFALQNRHYLDGARVLIKDSNGKDILEAVSDGPLFFAELPKGIYTVEATAMGHTEEQIAHVPSKGQAQLYFAWKPRERSVES
jgi:hypothetical protein